MLGDAPATSVRDRVLLLRAMPNLASLDEHTITSIAEQSRVRRFRAGRFLIRETEPVDRAFIVFEGQVTVSRQGRIFSKIDRYGAVGLVSIMARDNLGIEAQAITTTLALEVPADALRTNMYTNFSLVSSAMRELALQVLHARGNLPAVPRSGEKLDTGTWRTRELTMVERLLQLRATPFGQRANLDALAELARSIKEVRFAEGDIIWRPGDAADHWVRIDYGRVSCETPEGRRVEVASGYAIGIFDALAGVPRGYTAKAETPLILLRTNLIDHLAVLEVHVPLAAEMTGLLARALLE